MFDEQSFIVRPHCIGRKAGSIPFSSQILLVFGLDSADRKRLERHTWYLLCPVNRLFQGIQASRQTDNVRASCQRDFVCTVPPIL